MREIITRRAALSLGAGAAGLGLMPRAARAATLEKPTLKLGLPVPATSFMPVYVAAAQTWKAEGLNVELVSFRGDAEAAQALAGGSVDLTCQSFDGLINLVEANQPVAGFYAGFWQADFAWAARPAIKDWAGLKGKLLGVSTFGSLTDALTRFALRKNGLDPEKDVQIIQAGPARGRMQALQAGRLDGCILSPPDKWTAEDAGMTMLGSQARDVAPEWPKHVFIAMKSFIDANPNTLRALLRAHVAAIRWAKGHKAEVAQIFQKELKYSEKNALRSYAEVIDGYDERGRLPETSMPVFWRIMSEAGTVKEAWPEAKYFDRRFVDAFDSWAPA
jgi:NitT/TauT family transport system substrate-binding protein